MKNYFLLIIGFVIFFVACRNKEFGSAGRGYAAIVINEKKLDIRLEKLYKNENYYYPVVLVLNHKGNNYLENIKYNNEKMEILGSSFSISKNNIPILLYDYTNRKVINTNIAINSDEYSEIWKHAPSNNPPDWFNVKLHSLMAEHSSP